MAYVNTIKMLQDTIHNNYVVGAFNIVDINTMAAVIEAATEKKSPVIVQTSQKTVKQFGYKILAGTARLLAQATDVDVAMILDHGTDMEIIKNCIYNGWSAVMVDGSSKPFEENIKITRDIADIAHKHNVSVEGELGHIGGVEEHINVNTANAALTDPEKILQFKKQSGVDSLAVAIGTQHGLYKGKVSLDFERFEKIMKIADFPIVIHGCSDLPENDFKKIVSFNPSKMNISTEIKYSYINSYKDYLSNNRGNYEPIEIIKKVSENIKKLVGTYMDKLNSAGKNA